MVTSRGMQHTHIQSNPQHPLTVFLAKAVMVPHTTLHLCSTQPLILSHFHTTGSSLFIQHCQLFNNSAMQLKVCLSQLLTALEEGVATTKMHSNQMCTRPELSLDVRATVAASTQGRTVPCHFERAAVERLGGCGNSTSVDARRTGRSPQCNNTSRLQTWYTTRL